MFQVIHSTLTTLAVRGSEWARKRAPEHAVDEVRRGVDEESATKEAGDEKKYQPLIPFLL
jgi:hypothetical protein